MLVRVVEAMHDAPKDPSNHILLLKACSTNTSTKTHVPNYWAYDTLRMHVEAAQS